MTETSYSKEEEKTIDRVLNFTTERGLDNATIIQRFDKISEEYDEVQITIGWTGPQWMGESVACQYPSNREDIRILDVAAGTGLVSAELRKHGFVHIDGLEPAERMLEQAKKKNLYERYICDMLGDNTLDIADDTYTAVTMSGLSREIMKKLPVKALEELARVTKPGGHVMMNSYDYNFESEILRANLANLESRGIWKLESKQARQQISNGVGGLLHIYTVL
ncbi:methyltransferase-like protein 27 [Haliotis cracherodii]|uniref:methyltransferase-like protein 27 n=1 Tax=Haliotis cracherodii TaxID=6455 RepID=UPI0039EC92A3